MLSIKHILLGVGFLAVVFVIPEAARASHVSCGSSWASQGIECVDPARPIACGTNAAGVGQCRAHSAIPNATSTGQVFSCSSCSWSCPSDRPIVCQGACSPRQNCAISGHITTNECTGTCGGCRDNWSLTDPSNANSPCVAPASQTPAYINYDNTGALRISGDITAGRICLSGSCQGTWPTGSSSGGLSGSGTLNRIAKFVSGSSLGDSNISDTGTAVTVNSLLNVNSVASFSDDLNLVPGKGFRVDADNSIANLVIANNGATSAGSPAGIHATLHAGTGGLADLILQQGTNDRWALSVRPGSSNFELWRRTAAGAWVGPAMAVDYATGDITLNQNVAVNGTLRGNLTASDGSACGTGQILKRTASGWACAADDNTGAGGGSGCSSQVYVGASTLTSQGSVVFGGLGGYNAANAMCNDRFSESHVCSTDELFRSINCRVAALPTFGINWINGGAPGFTANANDCIGWVVSNPDSFGRYWAFDENGGQAWIQPCNGLARPFACCR